MPEIDEIRIEIQDNSKEVISNLNKIEKEGKSAAKDISNTFIKNFKAVGAVIAGSAVLGKIKQAFATAIDDSNKLEKALLGVDAAARATGRGLGAARDAVVKLGKDGQISLEGASRVVSQLLQQGLSVDQAFKFAQAGKQLATFEGLLGSTEESLTSFVKGLQTGSAELLENLSPRIRGAIQQLGGFAKVSQDATAKQKLINLVIAEGSKLNGDYAKFLQTGSAAQARFSAESDRLSAALGDTVKRGFTPILNKVTEFISGFTDFFKSLNSGSQSVLLLGGTLTALVPVILAAASAFGVLSLSLPVIGIITAIVGGLTGLGFAITELTPSVDDLVTSFESTKKELNGIERELKSLGDGALNAKVALDTHNKAEARLIELAQQSKIALTEENGALRSRLDIIRELRQEKIKELQERLAEINITIARTRSTLEAGQFRGGAKTRAGLLGRLRDLNNESALLNKTLNDLDKPVKETGTRLRGIASSANKAALSIDQLRERILEFNDEQLELTKLRVNKERDILIAGIEQQIKARKIKEADGARQIELIRLNAAKKITDKELDLSLQTAEKIGKLASGAQTLIQSRNLSGGLSGAAQIAGAFNPQIGGILAVGSTIAGLFEKITGGTKDLGEQEAKRQEQIRATTRLIEREKQLQVDLINLQRQREKLVDAQARRQIQINNILISDEAERNKANLQVLKDLAAEQAKAQGLQGSPAEISGQIQTLSREQVDTQSAEKIISAIQGGISNLVASSYTSIYSGEKIRTSATVSQANAIKGNIQELLKLENLSPDIKKRANNLLSILDKALQTPIFTADVLGAKDAPVGDALLGNVNNFSQIAAALRGETESTNANLNAALDRRESLLGLLERITDQERQISSSSNKVELAGGRASSFVDVGRLGLQSLGVFRGAQITPEQLTLPTSLNNVAIAAKETKSFQERQADSLDGILNSSLRQEQLLATIAASVDSSAATNASSGEQLVLSILSDINNRSIQ